MRRWRLVKYDDCICRPEPRITLEAEYHDGHWIADDDREWRVTVDGAGIAWTWCTE